jgi:peptide/nickel transport system ATP-binding protein
VNSDRLNANREPTGTQRSDPLLRIDDLKMHFPIQAGLFRRTVGHVRAVDGVSLSIKQGQTVGLVGESGCGKTTLARCVLRIYDPTAGAVIFQDNGASVDLTTLTHRELRPFRQKIRMVFQDPYESLNPRMTVLDIVGDSLRIHGIASGRELEERVRELLLRVGLRPEYMRRYPHAFSGGERQRIGVARALALEPKLVVCDEPVSALDVSVRAQTLNLLKDLQAEFGLTYLFIAHDLSVVEHLSDRTAVMYVGKLVEYADTDSLYSNPQHPYTEALMSAVPIADPYRRDRTRIRLQGDVADPANPPSGCYFHPRCRYTQGRCEQEEPALRDIGDDHLVACHFAEQLSLQGAAASGS